MYVGVAVVAVLRRTPPVIVDVFAIGGRMTVYCDGVCLEIGKDIEAENTGEDRDACWYTLHVYFYLRC